MSTEYHIQHFGPCKPNWPQGGWSLYRISGDDIARRIKFGSEGKAIVRDSWCGYIGISATLTELMQAIEQDQKEQRHD